MKSKFFSLVLKACHGGLPFYCLKKVLNIFMFGRKTILPLSWLSVMHLTCSHSFVKTWLKGYLLWEDFLAILTHSFLCVYMPNIHVYLAIYMYILHYHKLISKIASGYFTWRCFALSNYSYIKNFLKAIICHEHVWTFLFPVLCMPPSERQCDVAERAKLGTLGRFRKI